jgi:hypothetical protein
VATPRRRILILGGYGVFGRRLARELLDHTAAGVVLAGRDLRRAAAACHDLDGGAPAPLRLDLAESDALARATAGCSIVACTAGPFQTLRRDLPRQAVEAGAHWLDLADSRGWIRSLLGDSGFDRQAAAAGCAVIPGLSTVPALSGVLARWCKERLPAATRGEVVLAIGNRNAKGAAAIATALGAGLAAAVPVRLPIGRRIAYRYTSPDAALRFEDLGAELALSVGFEPGPALLMGVAGRVGPRLSAGGRDRLARWLARLARPFSRLGSSVSCLQVELWDPSARRVTAALVASGQRLAVLPSALAAEALLTGELHWRGVLHPVSWLPTDEWLARLQARQMRVVGELSGRGAGGGGRATAPTRTVPATRHAAVSQETNST